MLPQKDRETVLFFNRSTFMIAELLFNFPSKTFHVRMLEKETSLSTTAITNSVQKLAEYGICKVEETPLTKNISANMDSEAYRFYKKIFNLYRLERWGLVQNITNLYHNPEAIVLFGSYARGEDAENSDIDILVITPQKEVKSDMIIKYERNLQRKINLIILPNLRKSEDSFKNTIANGIILHGFIKVV